MRHWIAALIILSTMVIITGCSDDDPVNPGPTTYAGLQGHVIDDDGNPRAGVSIGLIYDIPGVTGGLKPHDLTKASPGDFPDPRPVRLWITDYAGDLVITLLDTIPPGAPAIIWDGLDEDGNGAPSGMYTYHLEIEGTETLEHDMFLLYLGAEDFLRAPNAVTDENGMFQIPDSLIPVGELVIVTDEEGNIVDEVAVGDQIGLRAVIQGSPNPEWVGGSVEFIRGGGSEEIELTLP